MRFQIPLSVPDIAALINAEAHGCLTGYITGLNELNRVESGDVVFADHPKYIDKALKSDAKAVIVPQIVDVPDDKAIYVVQVPLAAFNQLIKKTSPKFLPQDEQTATIGEDTKIFPHVYLGNHVKIGRGCCIHPNTVIYDNCIIGDNVTIHANATIGADAFYYQKSQGKVNKLLTCGNVIVHDNVEIGANTSIDSGVTSSTIIGKQTKIDNHVHIGHDTVIGKRCIIAAQVGIAGATKIQDDVTIWGQVGINSKIVIEKGVTILSNSAVANSLKADVTYLGIPAVDAKRKKKELVAEKYLPSLVKFMRDARR